MSGMEWGTQPTVQHESWLELKDGTRVHLRPIRPEDEERLHETFARMSERSVYFRFFSPLKQLPEELARRLARVDYEDRLAICAVTHRPDGKEHIMGVARYDRAPGTDVAEVAVAVVDEAQRKGLGSGLLRELARIARGHGIRQLSAIVLPENTAMIGLVRHLGLKHRTRYLPGYYEITFDI
jgi:RimJ/RimL family protein N-acetyltransferase